MCMCGQQEPRLLFRLIYSVCVCSVCLCVRVRLVPPPPLAVCACVCYNIHTRAHTASSSSSAKTTQTNKQTKHVLLLLLWGCVCVCIYIAPPPQQQQQTKKHSSNIVCSPTVGTWLILPVVICLSQRLSHACLSISLFIRRDCGWLIKSVIVYLMVSFLFFYLLG
jgi:hypothetical protein